MDKHCVLVINFFDGDISKINEWFRTPNPSLGNVSPIDMINAGKVNKLKKFIETSLVEKNNE